MNELATQKCTDIMMNVDSMDQIFKIANVMSEAKVMVPQHLHGKQADCIAVILQAMQWGMNPFSVAQKTHLVNGTLGYEAQLVNSVISSSKAINGRFHYEYDGDWDKTNCGLVRCGAVINGESDITWGEWLDISKVTTKNSPLWKSAPKQQSAYLAVKYWSRVFCPEVIMGVYDKDDLKNTDPEDRVKEKDITPNNNKSAELINKPKPKQKPKKADKNIEKEVEPKPLITEDDVKNYCDTMDACEDEEELKLIFGEAYTHAQYAKNKDAIEELTKCYERAKGIMDF